MNQLQYLSLVVYIFLFVCIEGVVAFQSKQQIHVPRHQNSRISQTELYGLFGRLRKERKIEQVTTIKVGDTLPSGVEIERLLPVTDDTKDGEQLSEPVTIQEALGPNKALLVGMPGAFTTTCSQIHLPGYVQSAKKLRSLGIDTIAVITTNDRFVNSEWSKQQGVVPSSTESPPITMLCDADGDFIKSIGLADDMGFGIGVRSKRFAMITDNGVVSALLTDEGMDDCKATSVENVIKLLTPEPIPGSSDGAIEIDGKIIVGVIGAIIVGVFASMMGGNDTPVQTPPPQQSKPTTVIQKNRVTPKQGSDTTFSLIDEYLKN